MDKVFYALLGVILGAIISTVGLLIREWLTCRNNLRLELIRLYDKDTLEAYKRLYLFTRKLTNISFPLSTHKRQGFLDVMLKHYKNKVEKDLLYFNAEILSILEGFDRMYTFMTSPDLIPETEKEVQQFLEKELFAEALKLENEILQQIPVRLPEYNK